MKIDAVLFIHGQIFNYGYDVATTLDRILRSGGLFDQDYTAEYDSMLDEVYDLLNDMRAEGVEDARYWMDKILQYQQKHRAKLHKLAV